MEKTVKLLVFLIVLAVGIRHGLPWIQEQLVGTPIAALAPGAIPEPAARCLRSLRTVRGEFEATRNAFANRREREASLRSAINSAREVCACRLKTCAKGNELLDVFDQLAGANRNDPTISLERADALYDEAKRVARTEKR